MSQRTKSKYVMAALVLNAYGASKRATKRSIMQAYRIPARKAKSAVVWAEFTLYSLS